MISQLSFFVHLLYSIYTHTMHMKNGLEHIPKRCTWIIGVDEAGRGPVAGPLSVGIVMMRRSNAEDLLETLSRVRDSKRLSPGKREDIMQEARALEVSGHLFARTILTDAVAVDERGISRCLYDSIQEGIDELLEFTGVNPKSVFVYLDGSLSAPKHLRQQTVIKGDDKIFAIALASIYAKVVRDQVMEQYDIRYPAYGFYNHKGYGTKEHMDNIKTYGLSPIHRKSYLKKYLETV